MAGLPVAGLAPVAGTQAPAQRQAAPTQQAAPQQAGLAMMPQVPSAGAPDRALAAIDYADTMILPAQGAGVMRGRGAQKFGAPRGRTRSDVEQELAEARNRLSTASARAGRMGPDPATRARNIEAARAEVTRLETELGRMPVQLGAIPPAPARPAASAAGVRPDMMRFDGTVKSERGFLGPITNNISGKTMTELSVGSPGSPEGYYPLLVPTLTQDEIRTLQNLNIGTDPIPPSILRKAKAHADQRTAQGLSPFYQDGETTAAPATTAPPKQQKAQEELVQAAQSVPMGEGPAPQKLADTVAAAAGGIMYGKGAEAFDPQAIDTAVQQSLQMRQALVAQYNALNQYGFGFRAAELIPQIQAIDLGLYKAQGEMGVYEGVGSGNWSRAVTVLSQFKGIPHQVLDRGDGTFDLYVNGRVSETAQSPAQLADYFRYQLDEGYRNQKSQIAGKEYERQVELEKEIVKAVIKAQGDQQVALTNIQGTLAQDAQKYGQVSVSPAGDGRTIIVQRGDNVFGVDLQGNTYEVGGTQFTMPTTTRVPGIGG